MPWEVKKENDKFCVFDKNGSKLKCYNDKSKAEQYKEALYANSKEEYESLLAVMLEEHGPVISGIAVTNDPHLPLPPIGVVDFEGEKFFRIPFLRKGIFSHPNGNLVFDDKIFDRMLENHSKKVSHSGVKLRETHAGKAALSWFDDKRNGKIVKESDPDFGDLLVAYGKPVSQKALDMIESGEYGYASVEFYPNYKDKMLKKLSTEDIIDEITLEDLVDVDKIILEETMEEKTITLEEYNDLLKSKTELEAALNKIAELEEKITSVNVENTPEIPEEYRTMLEQQRNEISALKRGALATQVDLIITKAEAYRDQTGRGHSPVLLETVKKALLNEEVTLSEDKVIKLESKDSADIADYYRKVFIHLLENLPGQVSFETQTEGDDEDSLHLGEKYTDDDYKYLWKE